MRAELLDSVAVFDESLVEFRGHCVPGEKQRPEQGENVYII